MKKIISHPIRIPFLFALVLLATNCSETNTKKLPELKTADKTPGKSVYQSPANYAAHRSQQQAFSSGGGKIAFTDHGTGEALVLLHGVPTSSWMYRKMIPSLQKGYRVISVDLLGYGSSEKPTGSPEKYSPENQASYVNELLKFLEIDRCRLLFHDMGGLVAWEMVEAGGSKIDSLYVLNTIISKEGFDHPTHEKGVVAKKMTEAYSGKFSSAPVLELTFRNMGLSSKVKLTEKECEGYVIPMQEGSHEALYEFFTGFDDAFFEDLDKKIQALSSYKGNVYIFWGEKDTVLTTGQLAVLKKYIDIDPANICILPDNSHFLAEEIPDILNEFILGKAR